jgi:hypothetical protein
VIKNISEEECQMMHDLDDKIQKLLRTPESKKHDPEPLKKIERAILQSDQKDLEKEFDKLHKYIIENGLVKKDELFNFDALKAIYQFRNYMESKTKDIIKQGKHFNAELLVEGFKLYDTNYDNFGGSRNDDKYNSAKNIVSWRKVIGYIERFVPACLAQALHQGVYNIIDLREKLERPAEFRYDRPNKLLPLDSNPSCRSGYDWAGRGGAWGRGSWAGGEGGAWPRRFTKLLSSKNISVAKLMQHPGSQSKSARAMR